MINSVKNNAKKKNEEKFPIIFTKIEDQSIAIDRDTYLFPLREHDLAFTKIRILREKLRCEAKKFEIIRKASLAD